MNTPEITPEDILAENRRRKQLYEAPYDPVRGIETISQPDGTTSGDDRVDFDLPGIEGSPLRIPREMTGHLFVRELVRAGSVDTYIVKVRHQPLSEETRRAVNREFCRIRCLYDFPYWAASYVHIKKKGGGLDILFTLNRAQRRLVRELERMRTAGKPIRLIMLKARQWGGSTCVQLYMAWLQLIHSEGLNSLIIAHQGLGTLEIKDMFDRMLEQYPEWLLTDSEGNTLPGKRMHSLGPGIFRVNARNCKVKLGSAERPHSCRGGDYNLIHCSEVGVWPTSPLKTPEDMIRSACSGVLYEPQTMIVLESTANGTGNYFYTEYSAAKKGESQFAPFFVPWYEIEQYSLAPQDYEAFAEALLAGKDETNEPEGRRETGRYLWTLWLRGATLEAINWYAMERRKYSSHGLMASEYPSDENEAFVHVRSRVFDKDRVEMLREVCNSLPAPMRGEIGGNAPTGRKALENLRFIPCPNGRLKIWADREIPPRDTQFSNRYITVVDIGGRSDMADWSVIVVIDRMPLLKGEPVEVVAQWRGHTDMDLLTWNAARIAAYYDNSLLVIEANTLESRDPERQTEGDQSLFILNQIRSVYPNLYKRKQSAVDIRNHAPTKYGFHTNVSTKGAIISNLVQYVREGAYVERDEECLDELLNYERRQNGSYGAISGKHDDMLMTRAIGLYVSAVEMRPPSASLISEASPLRRTASWY